MSVVHEDATTPYALKYEVTPPPADRLPYAGFTLADVTAAEFHFKRNHGRGAEGVWTATRENQSATTLRIVHVFAPGDVPDPDTVVVVPVMTTANGVLYGEARAIPVRSKWAI